MNSKHFVKLVAEILWAIPILGSVLISSRASAGVADDFKKADGVKAQMMRGDFVIFKGPLKDNTGNTVIDAGVAQKQTDLVLEQMGYLVEGVIGKV